MHFSPDLADQRIALDRSAGLPGILLAEHHAATDPDLIVAILEGIVTFAGHEWAPLDRIGDQEGARWTKEGVRMPPGFADAYRAFVEQGWGTIGVDPDWGGQGLPFAVQIAAQEILGTANLAFALCPMLTAGAIEALVHHGSPEQQRVYLPRLATGEWTGTMNLTEPQAGSDVGAVRTLATPLEEGRWSIAGTKIFISFGDHDLARNIIHLVLARTPGAPEGTKGLSLFLVPKFQLDADGVPTVRNDVRTVSIEHKMGLHASPTCILSFGDNGACVGELVGSLHGGMRAMFTMMNNARLQVALQGVQAAQAATTRAVAYARERIQSARTGAADRTPVPIIEHPDVRRMILRMKAQTQAARALVYHAAGQVDRFACGDAAARLRLELLTPLAKAHATNIANEVTSLGIQVHGGMGYIEETGAAQHYRDARILAIYEGTNGIQAGDLVARKLSLDNGAAFRALMRDLRAGARHEALVELIQACALLGERLAAMGLGDRLAASTPFLTMVSVATCGWLLEDQASAAPDDGSGRVKAALVSFYLGQIVPEALGLKAAALAPAAQLYAIPTDAFV